MAARLALALVITICLLALAALGRRRLAPGREHNALSVVMVLLGFGAVFLVCFAGGFLVHKLRSGAELHGNEQARLTDQRFVFAHAPASVHSAHSALVIGQAQEQSLGAVRAVIRPGALLGQGEIVGALLHEASNPSIERTPRTQLRWVLVAAHVER